MCDAPAILAVAAQMLAVLTFFAYQRGDQMNIQDTSSDVRYYDFRLSLIIIGVFFLALGGIVLYGWMTGFGIVHALLILGAFFLLGMSYGVSIVVDRDTLYVSYGFGAISSEVELPSIESCGIPENRFIRTFLYSPGCRHALEVRLRDGGRLLLPAEDPKRLAGLLRARL